MEQSKIRRHAWQTLFSPSANQQKDKKGYYYYKQKRGGEKGAPQGKCLIIIREITITARENQAEEEISIIITRHGYNTIILVFRCRHQVRSLHQAKSGEQKRKKIGYKIIIIIQKSRVYRYNNNHCLNKSVEIRCVELFKKKVIKFK